MLIVDALVRCTTDAAGQLVDKDGNPWVDLLATDAAEINPDDLPFRYRAIVTGPTFGRVMWTFEVPAGQITDLATGLSAALTEG